VLKKFTIAAIAAIAIGGWAADARASLLVEYSLNDGASYSTLCGSTSPTGTCNFSSGFLGDFLVTNEGATSLQFPSSALELSSSTSISNTGLTTADIWFRITSTDFTMPTGDVMMQSHIGGSVPIGSADNALNFTSCVSQTNNSTCTTSAPALTPDVTAGSYNADSSVVVLGLAAPFSIVELVKFTVGAGSTLNYSASTTLTPVPEPTSMALFGAGLFGLARSARRRLRKQI